MQPVSDPSQGAVPLAEAVLTVFVCANCARPGRAPTAGARVRPAPPNFDWPCRAREVLIPCAGRLQPEHILKAFDKGADAVAVVACDDANCHYLEGSRRALRRIEYVRGLLDEMGLGGRRLLLARLPGSAREDMECGTADTAAPKDAGAEAGGSVSDEELTRRIRAVRDEIIAQVTQLPPSGLKTAEGSPEALDEEELDLEDDTGE